MAVFSAAAVAITAIGGWIAGSAIGGALARLAISAALNVLTAQQRSGPKKQRPPGIKGRLEQGADLPRSILTGYCATAGSLVYHNTGPGKYTYARVTALSDYPVEDLLEVWVNGKLCTLDKSNPEPDGKGWPIKELVTSRKVTVNLVETAGLFLVPHMREEEITKLRTLGWVRFYDGTQTQADQHLIDGFSTENRPWSDRCIGTGVAYAITYFKADPKRFQGFPQVRFGVKGIRLQEPGAAPAWSDQPGAINYTLLSGLSHSGVPLIGPQTPPPLDGDEWAAEIAREREPVPNSDSLTDEEKTEIFGSTQVPARYRAGYEVVVSEPLADIIEEVSRASNAHLSFVGDRYRYRLGEPDAPVLTLSDDDILDNQAETHTVFPPLAETINAVVATYPDAASAWQNQTSSLLTNPDYEAEDGDRRLPTNVDLSAVPYSEQVQRLMASALADARQARTHSIPLGPRFMGLEVDDFIDWNSERNGYTAKRFRVDAVAQSGTGDVVVALTEVDPDQGVNWQPATDYIPTSPTADGTQDPATLEVADLQVQPVSNPDGAGAERRPAILFDWTVPEDAFLFGLAWQIRVASHGAIIAAGTLPDAEIGAHLVTEGLLPGETYEVRAAFVAPDAETPWSDWQSVTTLDLRLAAADLSDDLADQIAEASARHDATLAEATGVVAELRDAELPRIQRLESGLEEAYQRLTAMQWAQFETGQTLAGAGIVIDEDTGAVRIAAFDQRDTRISNVEVNVQAVEAQLSLTASVAYVQQALAEAVLDPTQIPLIDGLTARVTTVEQTLDAEAGTIATLSDTLTVDGDLVTMTTVTQTLDSLNDTLTEKVSTTEFDAAEQRLTAAETSLSSLGDHAAIRQAVEASRARDAQADAAILANIADLWGRWQGDEQTRTATAQASRELYARIEDDQAAQAAAVETVAAGLADANAAITEERIARATAEAAQAAAVEGVAAELDDVQASVTQQSTAVADLQGNAAATYTMRAVAGGASGAIELVAADDPVNGPTASVHFDTGLALFGGTIASDNYVAGESGWVITQDGNAQFNDLEVIGDMIQAGATEARLDSVKLTSTDVTTSYVYALDEPLPSTFESAANHVVLGHLKTRIRLDTPDDTRIYWRLYALTGPDTQYATGDWQLVDSAFSYHKGGDVIRVEDVVFYTDSFDFSTATRVMLRVHCFDNADYPGTDVELEYLLLELRQTKKG